jgi:hypothetical protein
MQTATPTGVPFAALAVGRRFWHELRREARRLFSRPAKP